MYLINFSHNDTFLLKKVLLITCIQIYNIYKIQSQVDMMGYF